MDGSTEPILRPRELRPRDPRVTLKPPLALGIQAEAGSPTRAHLVNLSRSGAAILTDVLLGDPGAALVLQLPAPATENSVPVPCEVRWVLAERGALPPRWLHGARFGTVDLPSRRLIDELLHDARRAAAPRRAVVPPA